MSHLVRPYAPGRSQGPVKPGEGAYHRTIRVLHWLMAAGFVFMWLSGVFVTNVEGLPFWVESDRQGWVRDLHKSVGLTLLGLLMLRLGLRFAFPPAALPAAIGRTERRLAHLGHAALYATVVAASLSGLAIADLHAYGNAYFGLPLPQVFPQTETVAGWAATPWAYVLHAVFAYGLLALALGHAASVVLHRTVQRVDLLPRMLGLDPAESDRTLRRLIAAAVAIALLVIFWAVRAIVTLGPLEEPRDYLGTTPFAG